MKRIVASMLVGLMMTGSAVAAGHGDHSGQDHSADSEIVQKRVARFKQSGADIQAIFKMHLAAGDYTAIEEAALRLAAWADEMPDHFPAGSHSKGARDEIWDNFPDFKSKAEAFAMAARMVKAEAGSGDAGRVKTAAQKMGGTCKSCHQSYRIKN